MMGRISKVCLLARLLTDVARISILFWKNNLWNLDMLVGNPVVVSFEIKAVRKAAAED